MSLPTPGEVRLRELSIEGNDISRYVREMSIFESIFRPFRSAQVLIMDNNNIAQQLKQQGNRDVTFAFDCGAGKVYEGKMKILSDNNINSSQNLRTQYYTLNLVSESFLKNATTKVQKSFKNMTGAQAIEKIHGEMGIRGSFNKSDSKGYIGEYEPYIVSNLAPFDAIHGIRTRLTSDRYKTGAYAYYEDGNGDYNLRQLEEMFDQMQVQEQLSHDPTMGKSYKDAYRQGRNIIGFIESTSFSNGGRFNLVDVLNSRKAARVSTYSTSESKYDKGQIKDPSSGKSAGEYNVNDTYNSTGARSTTIIPHDKRLEKNSVQAEKAAEERRYIQEVKNGPACTIQVLLDSGINCTVGKGVSANIAQPIGDMSTASTGSQIGGDMLVVNLRHHLKMYDSKPRATTILELAKGGMNKGTS